MKTFEQYKVDLVRKDLEKHVATRIVSHALNIEIIDFAKPGTAAYCLRYVFDKSRNVLTISGDLGFAVLWCAWGREGLTPEAFVKSFSENNLRYFNEKIKGSDSQYDYDPEVFAEEILEREKEWEEYARLNFDEIEELKQGLRDAFYGSDGLQIGNMSERTQELLKRTESEWYEWIHEAGRVYDIRLYHWVIGLHLAMEQLKVQKEETK